VVRSLSFVVADAAVGVLGMDGRGRLPVLRGRPHEGRSRRCARPSSSLGRAHPRPRSSRSRPWRSTCAITIVVVTTSSMRVVTVKVLVRSTLVSIANHDRLGRDHGARDPEHEGLGRLLGRAHRPSRLRLRPPRGCPRGCARLCSFVDPARKKPRPPARAKQPLHSLAQPGASYCLCIDGQRTPPPHRKEAPHVRVRSRDRVRVHPQVVPSSRPMRTRSSPPSAPCGKTSHVSPTPLATKRHARAGPHSHRMHRRSPSSTRSRAAPRSASRSARRSSRRSSPTTSTRRTRSYRRCCSWHSSRCWFACGCASATPAAWRSTSASSSRS